MLASVAAPLPATWFNILTSRCGNGIEILCCLKTFQSAKYKSDLINWDNSETTPYNLLDSKSYSGMSYEQASRYNSSIRELGSKIFSSRKGFGNNGTISTKPSNPNAIPYD